MRIGEGQTEYKQECDAKYENPKISQPKSFKGSPDSKSLNRLYKTFYIILTFSSSKEHFDSNLRKIFEIYEFLTFL